MTRKGGQDRGIFYRDGAWWIRFHDEHGREHREKVGPKQLARDAYVSRKAAVREHRFRPTKPTHMPVGDLLDDMLKRRADKASIRNMRRYAKRWRKWLAGKFVRQVTARDVELYRAQRSEKASAQTVYHELAFLRAAFRIAIDEGHADRQPVRGLKAPRGHRVRYLTDAEEARLFEQLPAHYHPLVTVAIHTGMRQAEQFSLRWKQVDLQARVVRLPKTKSGHPRVVELNDTALDALRSLPTRLRGDVVFVSRNSAKPLNAHNFLNRIFRDALNDARIRDFRWHDLRHTFATRLVAAGVDLRTVADLLGHTSLQMVMRYAHLQPGARASAVRALDARKGETGTGTQTGTGSVSQEKA